MILGSLFRQYVHKHFSQSDHNDVFTRFYVDKTHWGRRLTLLPPFALTGI